MIQVCSFGYKYNQDANLNDLYPGAEIIKIDCRHLPNPYHMHDLNGHHPEVKKFVFGDGKATSLVTRQYQRLLDMLDGGDINVVFAFGCIGGKHRSVACSIEFARQVKWHAPQVTPRHHGLEEAGLL